MTAVGRAYLAWCREDQLQRILSRLRTQNRPGDFLAHNPAKLERILVQTRQQGFATRDPSFVGASLAASPIDDGMAAIAVPLFDGTHNYGAINVEAFAARHLGDLQGAAKEIIASSKN